MQQERSALRHAILEAIALAAIFLVVHALVLVYVFPGFYDPFWPHHSDYYIAQALAYNEGGVLQILTQPRPLALLLFRYSAGWASTDPSSPHSASSLRTMSASQ